MKKSLIGLALAALLIAAPLVGEEHSYPRFGVGGDLFLPLMIGSLTFGAVSDGTGGVSVSTLDLSGTPAKSGFGAGGVISLEIAKSFIAEIRTGLGAMSIEQSTPLRSTARYTSGTYSANDKYAFEVLFLNPELYLRWSVLNLANKNIDHGLQIIGGGGAFIPTPDSGLKYKHVGSWPSYTENTPTPSYVDTVISKFPIVPYFKGGLEYEFMLGKMGIYVDACVDVAPWGLDGLKSATVNAGGQQRTIGYSLPTVYPQILLGIRYYFGD